MLSKRKSPFRPPVKHGAMHPVCICPTTWDVARTSFSTLVSDCSLANAGRDQLILAAGDLKGSNDELGQASQDDGRCIPVTAATACARLVATHSGEFDDDASLE